MNSTSRSRNKCNKKILRDIIDGVICNLVLSYESYVRVERLTNAINTFLKENNHGNSKLLPKEKVDNVLIWDFHYCQHRIVPDVVNQNDFIIAPNCKEAEISANEFHRRAFKYGYFLYYSPEDAKDKLKTFDSKIRSAIDKVTKNYKDNFADLSDVFPEFCVEQNNSNSVQTTERLH